MQKQGKIALVLGATGLVGGELVAQLLGHPNYKEVVKHKGIAASKVAAALIALANAVGRGVQIVESDALQKYG